MSVDEKCMYSFPVFLISSLFLPTAKTVELSRQNLQKNLTKRLNGGQVDTKGGNKYCNPDNFQQMFFGDAGLINDRAVDKVGAFCCHLEAEQFRNVSLFVRLQT